MRQHVFNYNEAGIMIREQTMSNQSHDDEETKGPRVNRPMN